MTRDDLILLFDYNYWANRRILDASAYLSESQFTADIPGLSMGNLRATLVHTLAAEHIWRLRCMEGASPTSLLTVTDLPTLTGLEALWVAEEQAMREGLTRLTDDAAAATLSYRTTDGRPMTQTVWRILAHVVNHGTQHRAEAAVALTAFGHSPGDVDLILYLRQ